MDKINLKIWTAAALIMFALSNVAQAGTVDILGMSINNLGMGGRMIRLADGEIFLDDAGMHLEGVVKLKITGFNGQRLVCALAPLNAQGETLEDRVGVCANLTGINVASDQQTVNLAVAVPYGWMDLGNERATFSFKVIILDSDVKTVVSKVVNVAATSINIDRDNLPNKLMGDLLGGGSGGGGLDMGSLLGGLLGGPSATSESVCGACDGTGLCPECYGDAFFDPSMCRRCSRDPGICRRCKGTKTETVNIELNGY
jgi:hypothetical protein